MKEKLKLLLKNGARCFSYLVLWIKHIVRTPFKAMRAGEKEVI